MQPLLCAQCTCPALHVCACQLAVVPCAQAVCPGLCVEVDGQPSTAAYLLCRAVAFVLSRMLRQLREGHSALLTGGVAMAEEVRQC